MNTARLSMDCLSEMETAGVVGGADCLARDIGQFLGGTVSYIHEHPFLCATATMILPPGGLLLAVGAGVVAAVKN